MSLLKQNVCQKKEANKWILYSCLCFRQSLDKRCIVRCLKSYVPQHTIFSSGCFKRQRNYHCLTNDEKKWRENALCSYLCDPRNTDHLLLHYLTFHPEFVHCTSEIKCMFFKILQNISKCTNTLLVLRTSVQCNECNAGCRIKDN